MTDDFASEIRSIAGGILHKDSSEVTDNDLSGMDSLGRITLIVGLENAFHVELFEGAIDLSCFTSIKNLSGMIQSKVGDVK